VSKSFECRNAIAGCVLEEAVSISFRLSLQQSRSCRDNRLVYFFLFGVQTVSVTVVLGFRAAVDGVTNRPLTAERLTFRVPILHLLSDIE
jgi:hypothetical protein